jgi:K(+)-stimulated pyrophosphate-energized sodium pump
MRVFFATIVGLVVGGVISSLTEYYTGVGKKPVYTTSSMYESGSVAKNSYVD